MLRGIYNIAGLIWMIDMRNIKSTNLTVFEQREREKKKCDLNSALQQVGLLASWQLHVLIS